MLNISQCIEKIVPMKWHGHVQTWTKVWLAPNTLPLLGTCIAVPLLGQGTSAMRLMATTGAIVAANAGIVQWYSKQRQEWTLPHDAWKEACLNVEEKLSNKIHRPYMQRMSALCTLSTALSKIQKMPPGASKSSPQFKDWSSGAGARRISVMLLTPEDLDGVHRQLELDKQRIEQWVEAAYIYTTFKEIDTPLNGTIQALIGTINANPACLALQLIMHPGFNEKKRIAFHEDDAQGNTILKFEDATEMEPNHWFAKTHWPQWLTSVQELSQMVDNKKTHSPMDLYRQLTMNQESLAMAQLPSDVFEADNDVAFNV